MDDIKTLVTRFYDTWNAKDRDGWLACCSEGIAFKGPGGVAGQGPDAGRMFWSLWQDAFPDNRCTIKVAVAEGSDALQESVFSGTHTQTFHTPNNGDIPATGKIVAIPYTLGLTYRDGKWTSFRLTFDQVELMTQLGLMPAQAGSAVG
jgi:predicted ester cyclase